jgi:hypothetical protein
MSARLYDMVGKSREFTQLEVPLRECTQYGASAGGAQVHGKEMCLFHIVYRWLLDSAGATAQRAQHRTSSHKYSTFFSSCTILAKKIPYTMQPVVFNKRHKGNKVARKQTTTA